MLNRRQLLLVLPGQAFTHQLLRLGIAGIGLRRIASNHARELVEQQDKCQPTLRRVCPLTQTAGQSLLDQLTKALTRLGILLGPIAEPQLVMAGSYCMGAGGLGIRTEPPLQQRRPRHVRRCDTQ